MPQLRPQSLNPSSSPTEELRASLKTSAESDLTALAARFSAESGGGLTPELSAELALEIVLNEIAEEACLATGATGAAIVLWRDGELVCRATSGSTAPTLGARLDPSSGVSGECIRTLKMQRCDDVLADEHADVEASQRLGVRSVMAMPILRGERLLGVFELFSSRCAAFGERDERTLEALGMRALSNLDWSEKPQPVPFEHHADGDAASDSAAESPVSEGGELRSSPDSDWLTLTLGAIVLLCAVTLGVLVGRHFGLRPIHAFAPVSRQAASTAAAKAPANDVSGNVAAAATQPAKPAPDFPPPGGLRVFENGKEVFQVPPGPSVATQSPGASAAPSKPAARTVTGTQTSAVSTPPAALGTTDKVIELSPSDAEKSLVSRVEPEYPELARKQRIQGAVVLDVQIGINGEVDSVRVLRGAPELVQASSDAVKQWRYKPVRLSGQAVRAHTTVTLNFRLPG